MGLPVARKSDHDTGHGDFPPRRAAQGSINVFVNGLPAHRKDDLWEPHCNANGCHDAKLASGSLSVFVNGLPLGRMGDLVSCGSTVAEGSPNVFAG